MIGNAAATDMGTYTLMASNGLGCPEHRSGADGLFRAVDCGAAGRHVPLNWIQLHGERHGGGYLVIGYQWYSNQLAIAGATNPVYAVTGAEYTNAGNYA